MIITAGCAYSDGRPMRSGELDARGEAGPELLAHRGQQWGVDHPGRDGADPDAVTGEVPRRRERQADHPTLRRGDCRLSLLTVAGCDRGRVDDDTPLSVVVGIGSCDRRWPTSRHGERAGETDVDDSPEPRDLMDSLATEECGLTGLPAAVEEGAKRSVPGRFVHSHPGVLLDGHIGADIGDPVRLLLDGQAHERRRRVYRIDAELDELGGSRRAGARGGPVTMAAQSTSRIGLLSGPVARRSALKGA